VHDVQRKVECVPKENNMWVQEVGRLMLDHALFISKPALPLDKLLELIQTVMKASGNGLTISGLRWASLHRAAHEFRLFSRCC